LNDYKQSNQMGIKAIYIGDNIDLIEKLTKETSIESLSVTTQTLNVVKSIENLDLVIYEVSTNRNDLMIVKNLKESIKKHKVILFIIKQNAHNFGIDYIKSGANDVFDFDANPTDIIERYEFIRDNYDTLTKKKTENLQSFKLPIWKRAFDILFSGFMLLLLSPVFLIIMLLIVISSSGGPFYASPRVGTGYCVFGFLKFRSMYKGSDNKGETKAKKSRFTKMLESWQSDSEKFGNYQPVEINDPRITRFGKFLRKTNLDELPQFINVLKGDMSIVGNRPLSLFEAEEFTTDQWAERFFAPAGITGLWQVTKRSRAKKMTVEERKQLDVEYAENYSFWFDLKILLRTIPILFRSKNR